MGILIEKRRISLALLNTRFRSEKISSKILEHCMIKYIRLNSKKLIHQGRSMYVEEHPDAYLKEIASEFNCSVLNITQAQNYNKKDQSLSRNYVRLIPKNDIC